MKKLLCAFLCLLFAVTALPVTASAAETKIKVACIGDSITDGNENFCEYPANLQKFLDADKYEVKNFGFGGTTAMKKPNVVPSYWDKVQFTDSKNYKPDIVIIMLGTNDVVNENWNLDNFTKELKELVQVYQNLSSKPTVYLCTPPSAFDSSHPALLAQYAVPTVKNIAKETGATLVDINALTADMKSYFSDGIHPNNEGYIKLAQIFYEQIFNGEVQELTVKADPGSKIVFAGQQKTVDAKGEVKLVTGNGKKSIKIEKKGYGFTYVDVNVKGKTYADCTGAPIPENVALSATATDASGTVTKVNDENSSTNWQRDANENYANVWLQYDFGAVKSVSAMELEWRDTERAAIGKYKFQYSTDGSTWNNLNAEFTYTDSVDTITFNSVNARYIKLTITESNAGKYRPCLYEWRVFKAADKVFTPKVTYAGAGNETSSDVSSNVSSDVSSNVSSNVSSEVSSENVSSEVSSENVSSENVTSDVVTDVSSEATTDVSSEEAASAETSSEETESQVSGDENGSNTLMYILIIGGIVALAAIAAIVIMIKKRG